VIINRRTLLASLGLALPAAAAQAATGTTNHKHKTHGSTHTTHASSGKSKHHKTTAAAKPAATPEG
jgi:hypothetical protein